MKRNKEKKVKRIAEYVIVTLYSTGHWACRMSHCKRKNIKWMISSYIVFEPRRLQTMHFPVDNFSKLENEMKNEELNRFAVSFIRERELIWRSFVKCYRKHFTVIQEQRRTLFGERICSPIDLMPETWVRSPESTYKRASEQVRLMFNIQSKINKFIIN